MSLSSGRARTTLHLLLALSAALSAADECCNYPDLRKAGQDDSSRPFSVGLRYGYSHMDDLQTGGRSISLKQARARYDSRPTEMTSHRVEAYAAYAISPVYEVSLTLPWVYNTMSMQSFMSDHSTCGFAGAYIRTHQGDGYVHKMDPVEGLGDLLVQGSIRLADAGDRESGRHQLFFRPGLKTPTGDYKVTASGKHEVKTPEGVVRMKHGSGYADPCMQPGTGSWDPVAQLDYQFDFDRFAVTLSGGYQLTTRNSLGYEFGDVASLGVYPSCLLARKLRLVTGLRYRHVASSDDHGGRYTDKHTLTQDPANTGGDLSDAVLALAFQPTESLSLNIGVSIPVRSTLNGIQMEPSEVYTCGASLRF